MDATTAMTYDEFLARIREAVSIDTDEKLQEYWLVGGTTGGSCWGGELYPATPESEPEFESLDAALERVVPDISFLRYKKLCRELIHETERHRDEYYGNSYDHRYKTVYLKELYQYLVDKRLLT